MTVQNGYKVRGDMLHHQEGQAAVSACPFCYLKEVTMAIINLRRYYPHYPIDQFLEVPDEVAAALEEGRRVEHRQDNRRSYYHVYTLGTIVNFYG